jgi:hypothetical protein
MLRFRGRSRKQQYLVEPHAEPLTTKDNEIEISQIKWNITIYEPNKITQEKPLSGSYYNSKSGP